MIGYLNGKIIHIEKDYVILDVNGVGYQVLTPLPYEYKLNQQIEIHIYTHVKEDQFLLFGFKNLDLKNLFLKLISVKGVGPKTALLICASMDYTFIINAINDENINALKKLPGIGLKSAQQIILDLKGKIVNDNVIINNELNDALEALKVMGFKEIEINKINKELNKEILTTDEYIKKGLKLLTK